MATEGAQQTSGACAPALLKQCCATSGWRRGAVPMWAAEIKAARGRVRVQLGSKQAALRGGTCLPQIQLTKTATVSASQPSTCVWDCCDSKQRPQHAAVLQRAPVALSWQPGWQLGDGGGQGFGCRQAS